MSLGVLINLQKIDAEIMEIQASLGELPKRASELRSAIERNNQRFMEIKAELDSFMHTRLRLEGENQFVQDKLKKYQEQVYAVTTNKEYDAISAEIENSERMIEDSELKVLELLVKEDHHTLQCKELEGQIENLKSELTQVELALKDRMRETSGELEKLTAQRGIYVGKLSKSIYTNYERIRNKKNGIALASVEDYKCMQCFGIIPAQTVVELRKMDRIILCETCGRILYVENSVDN